MNFFRNFEKSIDIKIVLYKNCSVPNNHSKEDSTDDKKLVSHLASISAPRILTPMFSALEAVMDILLPTIMAFIIDLGIAKGDMNAILKYGLLTFAVAAIALLLGILAGKYAAEASTGFAG